MDGMDIAFVLTTARSASFAIELFPGAINTAHYYP